MGETLEASETGISRAGLALAVLGSANSIPRESRRREEKEKWAFYSAIIKSSQCPGH